MYYNQEEKIKKYVYNLCMNLHDLENKTILLLGKPRAFNDEEFTSQMKAHRIEVSKEFSEDISLIVEGRMMTPYEQNALAELYEMDKYEFISIDELERSLAQTIDADVLLMSLKLSHDKERLKSFLQNRAVGDALFFKLLKMYSWGGEDFFDNDDNRDVSAAFILRFYENIERNHNVQYATTGFTHLVAQAKSSELLEAISNLEPMQFHQKIQAAIAQNEMCSQAMQERFFKMKNPPLMKALASNPNLELTLVKEMLSDTYLGSVVARNIRLTEELFKLLKVANATPLALNETLTKSMQEELLALDSLEIKYALALNNKLDEAIVLVLLGESDEEMLQALYANTATPQDVLQEAYKESKYHEALAKNENTPVEILYQLQLDSRYERFVKTNAAFGKHIQSENIGWLV